MLDKANVEKAKEAADLAFSLTIAQATAENVIEVPIERAFVTEVRDVVYKQVFYDYYSSALKMDLMLPSTEGPHPCVVYVAGGGFIEQHTESLIGLQVALAQAGYVVASVRHRVVPECQFPEPLIDVKEAIRWLRAHAETYGIDKERIGMLGDSAGGYCCTMTALTNDTGLFESEAYSDESSSVSCVADLYGCTDLRMLGAGYDEAEDPYHRTPAAPEALFLNGLSYSFFENLGGSVFDTPEEKVAESSPFAYITADAPAFLIMHGTDDVLNSPLSSYVLHKKLVEAGVDSTLYMVKGAGHDDPAFDQPAAVKLLVEFFDKHLK